MVCGFQCEIRVVWGLTLISLAAFHGFPFLPCRLTSLELNIYVLYCLRIAFLLQCPAHFAEIIW